MILAMDIGNSQIHTGVFNDRSEIALTFRHTTTPGVTSDELGIFLRSVLRENGIDPSMIQGVAVCTVVPELLHTVRNCLRKYFDTQPFVLQAGVRTGLKIKYYNPAEVGADRIANSIAATHLFPKKNVIVADFGTATTYCATSADKEFLGGIIVPGLKISMEALSQRTAKLPKVEISRPKELMGRSADESIRSGLYYGNLAMLRNLTKEIRDSYFASQPTVVIGSGGFARLFEEEGVFDAIIPDMVLIGLYQAMRMNL